MLKRIITIHVFLIAMLPEVVSAQTHAFDNSKQHNPVEIPDFVAVHLQFRESVSSATAKVGQRVALIVSEDKIYGTTPIVTRGTAVDGTVVKAVRRGHNRRNGELVIQVDRVKLSDGSVASLSSAQTKVGDSSTQPVFGPCTFPLPADPISLFHRGLNVVIPRGTEMIGILSSPHPAARIEN